MTMEPLARNYFVSNWSQELKSEGWSVENWHWRVQHQPRQTEIRKTVDQVFVPDGKGEINSPHEESDTAT